SLARAARETKQLHVRQPVARLQVAVPAAVKGRAFAELLDVLKDEVNAKDVEVVTSDHELVNLKGKPDFRSLGKRFGKDTPGAAAAQRCGVSVHHAHRAERRGTGRRGCGGRYVPGLRRGRNARAQDGARRRPR